MPDAMSTIYFLADDGVVAWLPSFLGSMRRWNPEARLIWIPFSEAIATTERWVALAGAERFDDDGLLSALESIGVSLLPDNPVGARLFRKLAPLISHRGPFLFLDSDVVVLGEVTDLASEFVLQARDLMFSDEGMLEVFRATPWLAAQLEQGPVPCFNTGFFVARGGCISFADVQRLSRDLPGRPSELFAPTGEQPFINLLFHVRGLRWASLQDQRPDAVDLVVSASSPRQMPSRKLALHWAGYKPSVLLPFASIIFREGIRMAPLRGASIYLMEHVLRDLWRQVRYANYRNATRARRRA